MRTDVWPEVEIRPIQSPQPPRVTIQRQGIQQHRRNHPNHKPPNHKRPPQLTPLKPPHTHVHPKVAHIAAQRLHHARRHHQQRAPLRRVPQPVDDQRREVGQPAVRDAHPDIKQEHQPGLGVAQRLAQLRRRVGLVLDAELVRAQALDRDEALARRDELGADGVVWEEYADEGAVEDGDGAGDVEEGGPGVGGEEADGPAEGAGYDCGETWRGCSVNTTMKTRKRI